MEQATAALVEQMDNLAHGLVVTDDLDPLMERIGSAQYVLLGEASHGTSEFYTWRNLLSQRLILEKGFSFIAVEGDWPDCYRVNRYIKGFDRAAGQAYDVLHSFERWPTWMWANWEIIALAEWLREHNKVCQDQVGFYGLDVYSLWESMEAIIEYLQKNYPHLVQAARRAYGCFEPHSAGPEQYARFTALVPESCEDQVVKLLTRIRQEVQPFPDDDESAFSAEQNALVAVDAERYYRAMVQGGAETWNIRDRHMMETLDRLMQLHGPAAKGIVWAHNAHVGDARATDMAGEGMVNIGQLAREQHRADNVVLVGFSSHHGTVIAGNEWGAPMQRMNVPPAQQDTWEDILHRGKLHDKLIVLENVHGAEAFLERGHRAIGVVYDPRWESLGNYVPTVLPERYDALLHIDETQSLHPLHIAPVRTKPPDTYPWGL